MPLERGGSVLYSCGFHLVPIPLWVSTCIIGYSASTTINRKDFGLTRNAALETGGVMVGDEVRIELNVQAVLQK
jgi:YceI-like domain